MAWSPLKNLGYDVWADILRLHGGKRFWRDIGEAIRRDAVQLIVVLSRAAATKDGVLNEIHMASERARQLPEFEFVIPVRIDDLPYNEFPPQLVQRQAIDFCSNWANGLTELAECLQRNRIPQNQDNVSGASEGWLHYLRRGSDTLTNSPEELLSSWLPITVLPEHLHFFNCRGHTQQADSIRRSLEFPVARFGDWLLSFAEPDTMKWAFPSLIMKTDAIKEPFSRFIAGQDLAGYGILLHEARRLFSELANDAWIRFAQSRGLCRYDFATVPGWFLKNAILTNNRIAFVDSDGKQHSVKLLGQGRKRKLFWHLAVSARASAGPPMRLGLRLHVVFSDDGMTPLENTAAAVKFRRRFCRMWFNQRWRRLLIGFVAFISDSSGVIRIPSGATIPITLGPPLRFSSPFGIGLESVSPTSDVVDQLEDTAADDDRQSSSALGDYDDEDIYDDDANDPTDDL